MQTTELNAVKQRFGIIGNTEALNRAIDTAVQVAPTDLSVLITGESGVGKEFFPQIIHQYSHRKHGAYIAVNCGAIPEGTIDAELFGHEKGSFTGAISDRKGYFEEANGGTIFLDEVGELPLATQVRLLRVLEAGEFMRVGSSKIQKTNVRVVAATNLNMTQAMQEGRFREDLYYRLNTVPVFVPPLRERKTDIDILFRKFAADFADKNNMPPIRLADNAKQLLANYYWKGNIRQLKNITEQISVLEQFREISAEILQKYLPNEELNYYPALLSNHQNAKTFGSEREILYQVLFDMRKDIDDLKKMVSGSQFSVHQTVMPHEEQIFPHVETPVLATPTRTLETLVKPETAPRFPKHDFSQTEFQDVEYQEDDMVHKPLTLEEMEKQMVQKTLEKFHGRRKLAATELNISERTLYRKIKEYELE